MPTFERIPASYQENPFSSKKGDSVMSTLRTERGRPTVEMVPGLHGTRTDIRQAITAGLVVQTGTTSWIDNFNHHQGNQQ